jgi:hypothetical protein
MLTTAEQERNQELFTKYQKLYNETGDKKYIVLMYPLLYSAVEAATCKINKHNYINFYEDKIDDAVMLLVERYLKKPQYNFDSLITLAYWGAVWSNRRKTVINSDKEDSIERLLEETLIHEEEHFYTMNDNNYSDYDELF